MKRRRNLPHRIKLNSKKQRFNRTMTLFSRIRTEINAIQHMANCEQDSIFGKLKKVGKVLWYYLIFQLGKHVEERSYDIELDSDERFPRGTYALKRGLDILKLIKIDIYYVIGYGYTEKYLCFISEEEMFEIQVMTSLTDIPDDQFMILDD